MKNLFLREEVKIGPKLGFLSFSQVFLDIVQDSSLGQCLTSSGAETSKKNCGPNWGRNDLFYSSVIKHPVKLACFFVFFCIKNIYLEGEMTCFRHYIQRSIIHAHQRS